MKVVLGSVRFKGLNKLFIVEKNLIGFLSF